MRPFAYESARDTASAVQLIAARRGAKFLAGGTNLVDLMREEIEQPELVVDVRGLPSGIAATADGGLTIGAAATNTAVANDPFVRERYPLVAQAILCGASGQIRNMATVGGNLMQRTRCAYFYDRASRCNKRAPGTGCDALEGFNRYHAILGASEQCVAVHPSDLCVALAALDTTVRVVGPNGERAVSFEEFHRLPADTPHVETCLSADELITAVEIAPLDCARRGVYRKIRDRSSYAFALVSVAAALDTRDGMITTARLALGGVGHKPWRALRAEQLLAGAPATSATFSRAAEAELADAVGLRHNAFKIELAKRAIVDVLQELATNGGAR
ncbi:MAG TPA: xanthine dehydrogenase family protein subunit M [Gammaproteobacteria bacterium]|nr:xanthine dehydrogenase family protein subunit M [Gammaproteobacteria bacterium]